MEPSAGALRWSASSLPGTLEARADSAISIFAGAVGFFFAFRAVIVLLMVRVFLAEPQTGAALTLALNYLLVIAAAAVSVGPARLSLPAMLRVDPMRWVMAFLMLAGLSMLWTQAASLAAAAAYWCGMAADLLVILLLARVCSARDIVLSLAKGYVWGACTFAAIAWLLPAQSDLRLGDEELLGPNQIAFICAFAIFLAQYLSRKVSRSWIFHAVFLAVTLLRTLSKTSIVAFFAGEAFILLRDRTIARSTKVALVGLGLAIVAAFQGLIASYYTVYVNAGNQAETLSGRLGIWAYFFAESLQNPWIGHGFHSVWKVVPPFGPFEARHAHNEWLQQFYAYGLIGVAVVAGYYTSFFRFIRRCAAGPEKTFLIGFLVFVLVRGLADTEAFDLSLPLWFAALISLMLAESVRGGVL